MIVLILLEQTLFSILPIEITILDIVGSYLSGTMSKLRVYTTQIKCLNY